ncbi:MAG: hypothetical protein U0800_12110 [Isosphaeraceae bacterium]
MLAWLYRVVRNAAVSRIRFQVRRLRRESAASVPEAWFDRADDRIDAEQATRMLEGQFAENGEAIAASIWGGLDLRPDRSAPGCSPPPRSVATGTASRPCKKGWTAMLDFEHDLNDDLKAIEGRLRGWAPSSPWIERDRLMFEAGRAASARKSTRFSWPMATAATASIALGALGGWKRRSIQNPGRRAGLGPGSAAPAPITPDRCARPDRDPGAESDRADQLHGPVPTAFGGG